MPKPFLYFFEAYPIGVQEAGAAMPIRYNYDKPENPVLMVV